MHTHYASHYIGIHTMYNSLPCHKDYEACYIGIHTLEVTIIAQRL